MLSSTNILQQMSDSYTEEMAEVHIEFWEWIDEVTKELSEASSLGKIAEVFHHITSELDKVELEFIDQLELILHGLHHNGETLEDSKRLVEIGVRYASLFDKIEEDESIDCMTYDSIDEDLDLTEEEDDELSEMIDDFLEDAIFWEGYNQPVFDSIDEKACQTKRRCPKQKKQLKSKEIRHLAHKEQAKRREQDRSYQTTLPLVESVSLIKNKAAPMFEEDDIQSNGHLYTIRQLEKLLQRCHTEELSQYYKMRIAEREKEKIRIFGPWALSPYYPDGELMDKYDYEEEMINAWRRYM